MTFVEIFKFHWIVIQWVNYHQVMTSNCHLDQTKNKWWLLSNCDFLWRNQVRIDIYQRDQCLWRHKIRSCCHVFSFISSIHTSCINQVFAKNAGKINFWHNIQRILGFINVALLVPLVQEGRGKLETCLEEVSNPDNKLLYFSKEKVSFQMSKEPFLVHSKGTYFLRKL